MSDHFGVAHSQMHEPLHAKRNEKKIREQKFLDIDILIMEK